MDDEQEDIRKKLEELKEKITAIDNANADKLEELYSEKIDYCRVKKRYRNRKMLYVLLKKNVRNVVCFKVK